jgi:hypothetical protein
MTTNRHKETEEGRQEGKNRSKTAITRRCSFSLFDPRFYYIFSILILSMAFSDDRSASVPAIVRLSS